MKRLKFILISFLLIVSCQKNPNFEISSIQEQKLFETKDLPIKMLPNYIYMLNDTLFCFGNEEKSVFIYNTNTGELFRNIYPQIENLNLLYGEDSTSIYNIDDHPNPYIRNYSKYRIEALDVCNSSLYLFYYILKPLIKNNNLSLFYIPYIVEMNAEGAVMNIFALEKDVYDEFNLGFTPNCGFLFMQDSLTFYTYSSIMNADLNTEIPVSKLSIINDEFVLKSKISFPFPSSLYFDDVEKKNMKTRHFIICQFRKFRERILFLNGKDIYDLYSGNLFFESLGYDNNDSIHRIKTFAVLPVTNDDGEELLVYIDEVIEGPLKFQNSNKYLVVQEYNSKRELYRYFLGKNVNSIAVNNKYIFVMKEEEEDILLMKFAYAYNSASAI